ncbi:MAG TPA: hypothetical protein VG893_04955 [Terracidiphilus sp.]|nr:hypothetical protein [Terracidiphilus sp.]
MAGLLCAFILAALTPVWVPVLKRQDRSTRQVLATLACTISALLQFLLVYLFHRGMVPQNVSFSLAGVGIPLCLGSLVLSRRILIPAGAKISGSVGIVLWVVLVIAH